MKKTIIFLTFCFLAAGWWQYDAVKIFIRKDFNFSWLSFKDQDFAAKRFKHMAAPDTTLKIAIIPPDENKHGFPQSFYEQSVKGAKIALNELEQKRKNGRKLELIIGEDQLQQTDTPEKVYFYGTDPSVFAVILPFAPRYPQQKAKVIAEYMGLLILHPTPTFTKNEVNSYLSFENTYPVESFSKAIAEYAQKRNLQSLLMVTERTDMAAGYAHNQDFWFSKKHMRVTSSFFYESEMIIDPMFTELYKKLEIFTTDSIYWGSMLAQDDDALHVTIDFMIKTSKIPESLMFLPVSYNKDQLVQPYLDAIDNSAIFPIIAYPVIKESELKRSFDKIFNKTYGEQPSHAAYYGYDSVMLLADGLAQAKVSVPTDIAQSIRDIPHQGIIANYSFSDNGTLLHPPQMQLGEIKNGALVELDLTTIIPIEDRVEKFRKGEFSLDN